MRRIEHIGIHAIYVYLKFTSKEAAAQAFHLLNNWKYHGTDEFIAKNIFDVFLFQVEKLLRNTFVLNDIMNIFQKHVIAVQTKIKSIV